MGFVLPAKISEKIEDQDVDKTKRKLYVAITRAKRFCTLSYATYSRKDSEQELAKVIADLPAEVFSRLKVSAQGGPASGGEDKGDILELTKLVSQKYKDRYVSVSLLNNFFECPWKWYFRNLLQLPEAKSESLEFGNKVHQAIDQILKFKKEILPEDKEVAKVVALWLKNRLPDIAPNRENEKSTSLKDARFPHLKIYGKIDLVEYLDQNHVRVTDFKTGSVRKKSDIEKMIEDPAKDGASARMSNYLRQLAMYTYLIQENRKSQLVVSESRLEFLEAKNEKESMYNRVVTSEEIELLVKDITDYDEFIKSGEWVARDCHYNSYGKNTECEYCKMAEIYG